jgi:hypothetical protein
MHVSMVVRRSIALFAITAAASGCSDASAPRAAERQAFDVQALQPLASRNAIDSTTTVLTIDPNVSQTYAFGSNWIYFPAHSICDPATSGYGIDLWEAPCTPVSAPVTVTVSWSNRGGYAFAHFSPELRFVPERSNDYRKWVWLYLHSQKKLQDLAAYTILYNSDSNGWIDESLTDPTLSAYLDSQHNAVYRRVKHFSGYMVAAAYSSLGGTGDASY